MSHETASPESKNAYLRDMEDALPEFLRDCKDADIVDIQETVQSLIFGKGDDVNQHFTDVYDFFDDGKFVEFASLRAHRDFLTDGLPFAGNIEHYTDVLSHEHVSMEKMADIMELFQGYNFLRGKKKFRENSAEKFKDLQKFYFIENQQLEAFFTEVSHRMKENNMSLEDVRKISRSLEKTSNTTYGIIDDIIQKIANSIEKSSEELSPEVFSDIMYGLQNMESSEAVKNLLRVIIAKVELFGIGWSDFFILAEESDVPNLITNIFSGVRTMTPCRELSLFVEKMNEASRPFFSLLSGSQWGKIFFAFQGVRDDNERMVEVIDGMCQFLLVTAPDFTMSDIHHALRGLKNKSLEHIEKARLSLLYAPVESLSEHEYENMIHDDKITFISLIQAYSFNNKEYPSLLKKYYYQLVSRLESSEKPNASERRVGTMIKGHIAKKNKDYKFQYGKYKYGFENDIALEYKKKMVIVEIDGVFHHGLKSKADKQKDELFQQRNITIIRVDISGSHEIDKPEFDKIWSQIVYVLEGEKEEEVIEEITPKQNNNNPERRLENRIQMFHHLFEASMMSKVIMQLGFSVGEIEMIRSAIQKNFLQAKKSERAIEPFLQPNKKMNNRNMLELFTHSLAADGNVHIAKNIGWQLLEHKRFCESFALLDSDINNIYDSVIGLEQLQKMPLKNSKEIWDLNKKLSVASRLTHWGDIYDSYAQGIPLDDSVENVVWNNEIFSEENPYVKEFFEKREAEYQRKLNQIQLFFSLWKDCFDAIYGRKEVSLKKQQKSFDDIMDNPYVLEEIQVNIEAFAQTREAVRQRVIPVMDSFKQGVLKIDRGIRKHAKKIVMLGALGFAGGVSVMDEHKVLKSLFAPSEMTPSYNRIKNTLEASDENVYSELRKKIVKIEKNPFSFNESLSLEQKKIVFSMYKNSALLLESSSQKQKEMGLARKDIMSASFVNFVQAAEEKNISVNDFIRHMHFWRYLEQYTFLFGSIEISDGSLHIKMDTAEFGEFANIVSTLSKNIFQVKGIAVQGPNKAEDIHYIPLKQCRNILHIKNASQAGIHIRYYGTDLIVTTSFTNTAEKVLKNNNFLRDHVNPKYRKYTKEVTNKSILLFGAKTLKGVWELFGKELFGSKEASEKAIAVSVFLNRNKQYPRHLQDFWAVKLHELFYFSKGAVSLAFPQGTSDQLLNKRAEVMYHQLKAVYLDILKKKKVPPVLQDGKIIWKESWKEYAYVQQLRVFVYGKNNKPMGEVPVDTEEVWEGAERISVVFKIPGGFSPNGPNRVDFLNLF